VKAYVCPDDQYDAGAGTCAAAVWIDQPPSMWSGWTQADLHGFAAGVLSLLAVWWILRTIIRHSGDIA
jgi:hypothetical protein